MQLSFDIRSPYPELAVSDLLSQLAFEKAGQTVNICCHVRRDDMDLPLELGGKGLCLLVEMGMEESETDWEIHLTLVS